VYVTQQDAPHKDKIQTQNIRTETSVPQMGFEPTISMFELAMTVHALDCLAIMISSVVHHASRLPIVITAHLGRSEMDLINVHALWG
jgi:hypothetical protein